MKHKNLAAAVVTILCMAIVLSAFSSVSFARRKLGDVDGDGFITSADARTALRASVKLDTLTEEEYLAADADGDGFVTSADARAILRASVKLDPLPDVYVSDGEEPTSDVEATPTDAETTTEEPSEPEETTTEPVSEPEQTTTEPVSEPAETTTEPVSEPAETTTEPASEPEETTTEPASEPEETTTEPAGIIPPAENNEFDILRSGTYYFTGSTVDSSGRSDLEIAKTPNTLYLGTDFNGVKIAILTIDGNVYLVNPAKNYYLDLNTPAMKLELSAIDMDVNEFANSNNFDFSSFPSLDRATRSERTAEGYVRYVFESSTGAINVTMDGPTLICLENARDGSVYRIDFYSVTDQVPSEKCSLDKLKNAVLQSVFIGTLL